MPTSQPCLASTLGPAVQTSFADLGTPLREVTFVVVDLETTGGAPADAGITEIGAVKVRGGEVLAEFASLVNPGVPVPAFVAVLTGITDSLLADAPPLGVVLPAFLEFAAGAVLVAHNAPYDVGFLTGACALTGRPWPGPMVVDTVRLARALVSRDEVPDCKLSTLARHFRADTEPNHRALADARATVDVLHALIGRVGPLGVHTVEELATYSARVSPAQRRKRHLADGLPDGPGVYLFRDGAGRVLYVGKSGRIRSRVRSYFTTSERRTRMAQMVALAESVTPVSCASELEAEVRELRLIAEHKPRYNRRSRHPERAQWVKLTIEAFPRLSVVRQVRDDVAAGAAYLGPFGSRAAAEAAMAALALAVPLRTCSQPLRPGRLAPSCPRAELGRCPAPCLGAIDVATYAELADRARTALTRDARELEATIRERLRSLALDERFEDAALWRDRLQEFARAAARGQELASLAALPEIVAARPTITHGWELHVVRHGRLAGATVVPPGVDPRPHVEAAVATAEHVEPAPGPVPAALPAETDRVLRWLESTGTRLVRVTGAPSGQGSWSLPTYGAGGLRRRLLA
ncbi:MAG: DEDD exonuclease domain-containing protein [Candidatus Nanopelagicales bacterium]